MPNIHPRGIATSERMTFGGRWKVGELAIETDVGKDWQVLLTCGHAVGSAKAGNQEDLHYGQRIISLYIHASDFHLERPMQDVLDLPDHLRRDARRRPRGKLPRRFLNMHRRQR